MRFIFRIDNTFSRVVSNVLHSNDSYGSTTPKYHWSNHNTFSCIFLSPTNEIHFSDRQLFFSGRKSHSPFERFERIDKLCTIPQPQNMQSSTFLSPTNDIHFSDRQLFFSGRKWCSPFVRFERINNLNTMDLAKPQQMIFVISKVPLMRFIFRIDNTFSRVVSNVLHSNDSNGSTTPKHHLTTRDDPFFF